MTQEICDKLKFNYKERDTTQPLNAEDSAKIRTEPISKCEECKYYYEQTLLDSKFIGCQYKHNKNKDEENKTKRRLIEYVDESSKIIDETHPCPIEQTKSIKQVFLKRFVLENYENQSQRGEYIIWDLRNVNIRNNEYVLNDINTFICRAFYNPEDEDMKKTTEQLMNNYCNYLNHKFGVYETKQKEDY